jgi:hypothetical protein
MGWEYGLVILISTTTSCLCINFSYIQGLIFSITLSYKRIVYIKHYTFLFHFVMWGIQQAPSCPHVYSHKINMFVTGSSRFSGSVMS